MSILVADLVLYGAASRPEDDTSTTGGAIAVTARPLDSQFAAAATPECVSDDAGDTMNLTIVGRLASGAIVSEAKALTGTTPVVWTNSFERILKATLASAATGVVTIKQGVGGTVRHTFNAGELDCFIHLQRAASSGSPETFYEKDFYKNTHATLSLTSAALKLTADPSTKVMIGGAPSVDDTATTTNRKTAPASVTFVDDNVSQNIPGDGNLDAGEAIGVWIKVSLGAGESATKTTYTVQLSGQST
jgi:hypothetical protein